MSPVLVADTADGPVELGPALSIFDPVYVGIDEFGHPVRVPLIERNILIGGEPGSGKSGLLNGVVAHGALSLDCRLVLLDGKRVELGQWRPCTDVFVGPDIEQALKLLKWLDALVKAKKSVNTIKNYRGHIRDAWKPKLGHMLLRDLRRSHIEGVLAELAEPIDRERPSGNVGRRVEQRSAATLDGYRRTIRAALSAAQRRELIATNPAQGRMDSIPTGIDIDDGDEDPEVWQPEQTARFLEHVFADRLSALYELAAYAGLRRAELCGLRWSDIDPDGAGLRVRQTVVSVTRSQLSPEQAACPVCGEQHVGRLFKAPKSRKGRRWVPLAVPAQDALARHRVAQQEDRVFFGADYRDHGLVFARRDSLPLRLDRVTVEFERHAAACGLPPVRLHDTRHGRAP